MPNAESSGDSPHQHPHRIAPGNQLLGDIRPRKPPAPVTNVRMRKFPPENAAGTAQRVAWPGQAESGGRPHGQLLAKNLGVVPDVDRHRSMQ